MKKKIVNTDISDAPTVNFPTAAGCFGQRSIGLRNKLCFSKKKGKHVVIGMTTVNGVNYKIEIGEYKLRGILDWVQAAMSEFDCEKKKRRSV